MARNNQSRSKNHNPEGRNQYSHGVIDYARERPATAAAAAAAAVGAGVFLWSRRSQISEQLSGLSEQIGQWSEKLSSSQGQRFETTGATSSDSFGSSETVGANSSLGSQSGATGSTGSF